MGWLRDILRRVGGGRGRPAVKPDEVAAALEKVRAHLDEGEVEDGLALVEGVLAAAPAGDDLVEARFLEGELLADAGEWRRALESYEAALAAKPDDGVVLGAKGEALFNLWELEPARAALERAVRLEPEDARNQRHLALVLDRAGERSRAEKHFRKAAQLDRAEFPLPVRVSKDEFDRLAREAIDALPPWVIERLGGKISFIVEDYPRLACLADRADDADPQTLGLFWGEDIARSAEARDKIGFVPNHILLFQRNLEQLAATRDELEDEVRTTVFHEVGHYLGYDEDELDRIGLA